MGCFQSTRHFRVKHDVPGQDESALEILIALGLDLKDIDVLYTAFWDIDADSSGGIVAAELFAYFEVESTVLERSIFSLFDEDNSGLINFMEFVCCLWNLLTIPANQLGSLAFLLVDKTGTRKIFKSDIVKILETVHNKHIDKDPALKTIMNVISKELPKCLDPSKGIGIDEFTSWVATYPSNLVSPITLLQFHLQNQIIGLNFWNHLSLKRLSHIEQQHIDFTAKLQHRIILQNQIFKQKMEDEKYERARLSRRGLGAYGDHRDIMKRNESFLVDFFKLNTPSFRMLGENAHKHKYKKSPFNNNTAVVNERKIRKRRSSSMFVLQKPKLIRKDKHEERNNKRKDLGIYTNISNNNYTLSNNKHHKVHITEEFDINHPDSSNSSKKHHHSH